MFTTLTTTLQGYYDYMEKRRKKRERLEERLRESVIEQRVQDAQRIIKQLQKLG